MCLTCTRWPLCSEVIGAPRAVHGRQRVGFVAAFCDQPGDEPPDLLRAVARRHHDRVGGRDDDEILDADRGHEPRLGAQIAIAGVFGDDIAGDRIAGRVLGAHLPQRVPRADIAPPHATGTTAARPVCSMTA